MSSQDNEALVRRIFASMDKSKNMNVLDDVAAVSYVVHLPGSPPLDREGMKAFAGSFYVAIPDLKHDVQDAFAAGNRVAVRLRLHGRHTGSLVGPAGAIPASGREVDFEALNIWRIENGKAAEHWVAFDQLGFLQQVGAMPAQ